VLEPRFPPSITTAETRDSIRNKAQATAAKPKNSGVNSAASREGGTAGNNGGDNSSSTTSSSSAHHNRGNNGIEEGKRKGERIRWRTRSRKEEIGGSE
jgi:hypothetical protein